jgi:phosphoglycerate dehydrogenase-like enzyme
MRMPNQEFSSRPVIVLAMVPEQADRFYPPELRARLEELGEVVLLPTPDYLLADQSRELIGRAEAIVTAWFSPQVDKAVLEAAPSLKAVVHSGGSVKPVATKDCYDHGVVISSQAWANAYPVAEYSTAMIVLSAKGVFRAQRMYRSGRTAFDVPTELSGYGAYRRQVGLIGASTIGRQVLGLLQHYDLDIVVSDPTLKAEQAADLGARLLSLDELLAGSAVVSLHAPLLPSTVGMIGARELALISDGATFINTARGALVDQDALVAELATGRFDAVLDVTDPEVPSPESALWGLPNLVLTPHVAGAAGTELFRLGASAVDEVARVLRGEPLLHGVPADRYDALA